MNKPKRFFDVNYITLLVLLCIVVVYGLSFYKRQAIYSIWLENRSDYVVDHITGMTSMDAYWWLKMARDLDDGRLGKGYNDPTKEYPDLMEYPEGPNLLAKLISLCKNFTDGDYYRAGLLLVPILAGLFVFPLYLYFRTLGFGTSAILGGLIGSFSAAYYERTMMGRVDTDLLNIFFPIAVSSLIILITKEKTYRANILYAFLAGIAMYLFNWWYQQPGIILFYLFFIILYLFLIRLEWKQAALVLFVFLLASGPGYVLKSVGSLRNFLEAYLFPQPTGQIVWPDIMIVIRESWNIDLIKKLKMLHGFLPIVFTGFAGLLYLYITRFRQMIPITPLIVLGAWSLVGPKRFTMYLAPFIGIGTGVLIEVLGRYAGEKLRFRPLLISLFSVSLMFILFFSTAVFTGYTYVPELPIVPALSIRSFLEIKKIVPKHSAMLTWWDYGYPLMEIGEFATYHDGGIHGGIRSTLVAKAISSPRQEDMVSMLSYLDEFGFDHLNSLILQDKVTADSMMELVFSHPKNFKGENVYVLYTEDMINKFGGISYFGTWDFHQKSSHSMRYQYLTCFSLADNIMTCKGGKVDLNRGTMSNLSSEFPLKAVLFVNDGYVINQKHYDFDPGYYLQVLMKNNKIFNVQVLDERLFQTNFNQQYLLGNYDRRYFEEVYNNFPVARVLKLKGRDVDGKTE